MAAPVENSPRVFKTAWFARSAGKAHITDKELCSAIQQVMVGQADDLGGGVFKKTTQEKSLSFGPARASRILLGL